jgi:hypothetical protein
MRPATGSSGPWTGRSSAARMLNVTTPKRDFPADAVFKRDPDVAYEVLEGEGVLYHTKTNTIHVLNPTATMIWEALNGSTNVGEIIAEFERLTGLASGVIEADVKSALHGFRSLHLLDMASNSTDPQG